jgi:hypothetical protein
MLVDNITLLSKRRAQLTKVSCSDPCRVGMTRLDPLQRFLKEPLFCGLSSPHTPMDCNHSCVQVIGEMTREAMTYVATIASTEEKVQLIECLRTISEGKIFVEVERARLTRWLAEIREAEGKVAEAAAILQEVQVRPPLSLPLAVLFISLSLPSPTFTLRLRLVLQWERKRRQSFC